jgi:putative redox protein
LPSSGYLAAVPVHRQRLSWSPAFGGRGADSAGAELAVALPGGSGLRPAELLPLALAACTAYDLVAILDKMRQELSALEVEVTSTQDDAPPHRFLAIALRFVLHGEVDEQRAKRALELSEKECAVAATLVGRVQLTCTLEIVPQ